MPNINLDNLEAVEECVYHQPLTRELDGSTMVGTCFKCGGKGTITRPLTDAESEEIVEDYILKYNEIELNSGVTVRRKK